MGLIELSLTELIIMVVALSMDAFAVSICEGLSLCKYDFKRGMITGLFFGAFQAGMPLIGYIVGARFSDKVTQYDHWLAFILLVFLGVRMVRESFDKKCPAERPASCEISPKNPPFSLSKMLMMSLATSIDALAVGITFAFSTVKIIPAVSLIGFITFVICVAGVKIGNIFGTKYKSTAERIGGIVLVGIGAKILIEHLFMS
ncbi:MAG: manganese efflux pump [Clostridiales bacterium]|nr:manganese efflux pump [Clostridiales bacterium]